jgi:uncharacterized protein YkwD
MDMHFTSHRLVILASLALSPLLAQRIEESSTTFTFNGAWAPATDPNASGGAYTASSAAGASITFTITGKNFVIYRKVDPTGGSATITVDGQAIGSMVCYFQEARWQVPAAIDGLTDGPHTIVLTVDAASPAGSSGTNVYFDAMENPGAPALGPTQAQTDAVTRANKYRVLMGLPPVRHNLGLGLAADAHAKYLDNVDFVSNGLSPHVETYGSSPAFTGAQPGDRDALFSVTGFGGAEDSNNTADPLQFVDDWIDTVYHREPFILYGLTEVGFGGYPKGSTMDFAGNIMRLSQPAATTYNTFPADGQTEVWIAYNGGDGPNNVTPGGTYGYPISLVATSSSAATPGTAAAAPTAGTLTDAAGNQVPVIFADPTTDGKLGTYFMLPTQVLTPATTYTARMTGVDSLGNTFDKTWKFTTAPANWVHALRAVPASNSYMTSVNWETPGTAASAQVEYGPTTAYGSIAPAVLASGSQTNYRTRISGFATMPVVHFRVTTKDATGAVYASADHTINNPAPIAPATIGYITVNPDPADTSFGFETAGPVRSVAFNYGTDTTYGTTVAPVLYTGSASGYYGDIFSLVSGTTYHYQITATDVNGNTFTTPDATFIVP